MAATAHPTSYFSSDYATARERFRRAAAAAGCALYAYPIRASGPLAEALTIDVAVAESAATAGAVVISSGLHGVEGYFGSAVQLALLDEWQRQNGARPAIRCVLVHALNPYGFAWRRRCNEDNVDLNRNLLADGEAFEGCADGYRKLDRLLNPATPPSRWEPVALKLAAAIARHGMPAFKQAVASGQYEYPRGLFYGGARPSQTAEILAAHFAEWLGDSARVMHVDLHSGLGAWGTYKLLLERSLSVENRQRLARWFGPEALEVSDAQGVSYTVRGGFGGWCAVHGRGRDYVYATAEFGTYAPIRVLAGLRAENQAYHWGQAHAASTVRTRERLRELFCPRSESWRARALERGVRVAHQAVRGVAGETAAAPQKYAGDYAVAGAG